MEDEYSAQSIGREVLMIEQPIGQQDQKKNDLVADAAEEVLDVVTDPDCIDLIARGIGNAASAVADVASGSFEVAGNVIGGAVDIAGGAVDVVGGVLGAIGDVAGGL